MPYRLCACYLCDLRLGLVLVINNCVCALELFVCLFLYCFIIGLLVVSLFRFAVLGVVLGLFCWLFVILVNSVDMLASLYCIV